MKKGSLTIQLILFLSLFASGTLFAFDGVVFSAQEESWPEISIILKSFLSDPVANFVRIDKIEDLNYWTMIHYMTEDKSYLKELFSRHFQVGNIDNKKLEILFNLLLKYSSDPDPYSGYVSGIIDRLVEILQAQPDWFVENLMSRPDWKDIVRPIIEKERAKLLDCLSVTKDNHKREEILSFLNLLENEKQVDYRLLEEFLREPDAYVEKVKGIRDWASAIGQYEQLHFDGNKTLWPEHNPVLVMSKWIKEKTDENKLEILFILMEKLRYGYHGEVISDLGARVFLSKPQLFIDTLANNKSWRSLLFMMSDDLFAYQYFGEVNVEIVIEKLEDTGFEGKVKNELRFQLDIHKGQIKEIKSWCI